MSPTPIANPAPPTDPKGVIGKGVDTALAREDVPVSLANAAKISPKVTSAVMAAISASPDVAVVQVMSPFVSKINWTSVITAVLTLGTVFGLPIDGDQKAEIAAALVTVGSFATVIFKTFFTKTISSASK